jgi:hypothetical protein
MMQLLGDGRNIFKETALRGHVTDDSIARIRCDVTVGIKLFMRVLQSFIRDREGRKLPFFGHRLQRQRGNGSGGSGKKHAARLHHRSFSMKAEKIGAFVKTDALVQKIQT